jgi:hypothetical protein
MAINHYFEVFSNDGSTTLFTTANRVNGDTIITVTETGLTIGTETYTYSGTKKFVGVSFAENSTSPDLAIGKSFDGNTAYVYIVEAAQNNPSATTFDLTTLGLTAGTYSITAKAIANGYLDSAASNAVRYTVVDEEVQDELAGTWVFNDVLDFTNFKPFDVYFFPPKRSDTSNNYDKITNYSFDDEPPEEALLYNIEGTVGSRVLVYDNNKWEDEAYKTITITSKLSEVTNGTDLLAWLKANATKQAIVEPDGPEEEESMVGTWVFTDNDPIFPTEIIHDQFTFKSYHPNEGDGFTYNGMAVDGVSSITEITYDDFGYEPTVFRDGHWEDYRYKTIEVLTEPQNVAIKEFIKANATKQGATSLISFTIDGTSYQAEENMEWRDWCLSEYNTGGYLDGANNSNYDAGKSSIWAPDLSTRVGTTTSQAVDHKDVITEYAYVHITASSGGTGGTGGAD